MSNRAQLIKRIHTVAYSELKLDEATYRTIVLAANDRDKTSCSDLYDRELELVLATLRRLSGGRAAASAVPNESQHKMIAKLMDLLGWNWSQTAKLCKRLTGWDNTKKCSAAELRIVLTAMINIVEQNHASGKRGLSHTELFEFRRHTRRERSTINDQCSMDNSTNSINSTTL